MKIWKVVLPVAATLLYAGEVVAQADDDSERKFESHKAEYSVRLREAEERMEQAARQIAKLTSERLPQIEIIQRRFEFWNKPRLGITIDGSDKSGPVAGVEIEGVTPGSAADDAGLRAGDVITAINGESLSSSGSAEANKSLLDFMRGVEEGDQLKVEYLRNGNVGTVEVSPRIMQMHAFSWAPDGKSLHIFQQGPSIPEVLGDFRMDFVFPWAGSGWGSMELVELSEGLGKYFGTKSGLLVVSAPKSDNFELRDGDVIRSIDGREPKDVRHAMRILSSYRSGEKLTLEIMRDKKKRTLEIEIPAEHRGALFELPQMKPARAPARPKAAPAEAST
ncbi:MAG: PDZ domain-containing protein [Proteobacteria bacterium]|nr:PDZ domain-containing protein [Pseudomonadota bacterium]